MSHRTRCTLPLTNKGRIKYRKIAQYRTLTLSNCNCLGFPNQMVYFHPWFYEHRHFTMLFNKKSDQSFIIPCPIVLAYVLLQNLEGNPRPGYYQRKRKKKIPQQAKPSALPFHYALQCEVPHTVHQSSLTQFHISTTGHARKEHDLGRALLAPASRICPKTCKRTHEQPVIHLFHCNFSPFSLSN